VSNNRPDMLYMLVGAGVPSAHIPSLCVYTKVTHQPRHHELILHVGDRSKFPPSTKLLPPLSKNYRWEDLFSFKAIVHMPYEISTMSIFEQVSAGVPVFFPTKRFYRECVANGAMHSHSRYASAPTPKHLNAFFDSLDVWFDGADFYTEREPFAFKFVYFYDSFDDMVAQAETFHETAEVVQARSEWLAARKEKVLSEWRRLLDPVIL
jgi:hypothetical protein